MGTANNSMTAGSSSPVQDYAGVLASEGSRSRRGWIRSPLFDLGLFTLSPLAGLAVILPALASPKGIHVWIAATYLIAIPHYVSSFSFYMGDQNLAYYRTRRLAFFAGPVLILLAVMGLRLTRVDALVQSALYTWNVYHVSMQSVGILALYRRLNGGSPGEGGFARIAILGINASLAFLHIDRFPAIYDNLVGIHFPVWIISPVCICVALVAFAFYLNSLRARKTRMGRGELAFLISSLLLFHPYLWVRELNIATYGMLMGHFLQYLGIVWLLNRRKYSVAEGSGHQRLLSAISRNTPLLVASLVSVGLVFYALRVSTDLLRISLSYTIIWNSLSLVHFYLDGFLWHFKDPFVRVSVGPYLVRPSQVAES
jgi:hypothetical protein